MAQEWIKVEKATARKPEVLRISSALNIHPDHAFGLCVRFWCWCDDQCDIGHACGVTLVTLDLILGHTGFATQLVKAGWLNETDDGISIPHFEYHLSQSSKTRAQSAIRKDRSRSKRDIGHGDSVTKAGPDKIREEKRRDIEQEASASVAVATHPQWQETILEYFDATFGTTSRITAKRKTQLNSRWKDQWWQGNWQAALDRGGQSAFLRGVNDRGWIIDFEFFLKPDTATKILEGKYDDRQGTAKLSNAQAREQRNADSFQWIIDGAEEARRIADGNGDRASTAANVLVEDGG